MEKVKVKSVPNQTRPKPQPVGASPGRPPMDKYESAGGDGAGHDSVKKQNQQKAGPQTDIPGEMEGGKGVRPQSAAAEDTKDVEPLKTPKVYPPPGFKPSE